MRDTRKAFSFALLHRLFHRKEDNRMKPWAERFYNSDAWRSCRDSFLKSKGYLCERCSTPDDPVTAKIAHHKTYLTKQNINDPYIALSWDNLEALCQDCHNKEHHRNDKKNGTHSTKRETSYPPLFAQNLGRVRHRGREIKNTPQRAHNGCTRLRGCGLTGKGGDIYGDKEGLDERRKDQAGVFQIEAHFQRLG